MNRKMMDKVSTIALVAAFGAGVTPLVAQTPAAKAPAAKAPAKAMAAKSGDIMVPKFEADPYWPKPLPNGWVLGMTIGVAVDPKDNVWIVHRPAALDAKESYGKRGEGVCCSAAPDVLEFDKLGNLIRHWGKDPGHDWPASNHGILIDKDGNVWLGANANRAPSADPGSKQQYESVGSGYKTLAAPVDPEAPAGSGAYHDSFVLKFSPDGKFLGEIGKAYGSKGSLDKDNVRGVAQLRIIPSTGELLLADGYGNHRVSLWDTKTMKMTRMWGAYGKAPTDLNIPYFNTESPQFGNPVHCAQPSNDGLIYVCDRENNRVQIFKVDGTYLKQFTVETMTRGDGAPWEIAFSKDAKQKFMFVNDGANNRIHVYDRESLKELYWFGGGGRQPGQFYAVHSIDVDSHGDLFTTETYHGQRVQKWVFKGMVPLSQLLKEHFVGNTEYAVPNVE